MMGLSVSDVRPHRRGKQVLTAGERSRRRCAAMIGPAWPSDCSEGVWFEGGKEHQEAQRSDTKQQEAQKFFHVWLLCIFQFAPGGRLS